MRENVIKARKVQLMIDEWLCKRLNNIVGFSANDIYYLGCQKYRHSVASVSVGINKNELTFFYNTSNTIDESFHNLPTNCDDYAFYMGIIASNWADIKKRIEDAIEQYQSEYNKNISALETFKI